MLRSVVALSRVEAEACFERLLLDEEEECSEVEEVFGRRLRFARALLVLSRARAAIDNLLFFDCDGMAFSQSRLLEGGYCVLGSSR